MKDVDLARLEIYATQIVMMSAIIKLARTSGNFTGYMSGLKRDALQTAGLFKFQGIDPDNARVARNRISALVTEMVDQMETPRDPFCLN